MPASQLPERPSAAFFSASQWLFSNAASRALLGRAAASICAGFLLWLAAGDSVLAVDRAPLPNIVIVLADDMGLGDTSAYQDFTGNSDDQQLDTPNMERLARRGVRFLDAHTPSSRCSPTRYSLLTGRYAWRSRLKHWVLFGAQGDPLIERSRPTLATILGDAGYRCLMVGKWHVGLRYRRSDGSPAAGWEDADLTQPMHDTPLDHGFDECRFTSRSHGTSGPRPNRNTPQQTTGPGHIHGRTVIAATGDGKGIAKAGPDAYELSKLGSRHSDHALQFLASHLNNSTWKTRPFFLYYACNSNHTPYTPDAQIGETRVSGAGRSKSGQSMGPRGDFIFENDVALGRLLDYLDKTPDPRNEGHALAKNTIVVFTSDNGAERKEKSATGPFRSNKGSVFEGGHRVPFLVSWPASNVGDGENATAGTDNASLVGLQDLFATLDEIVGAASQRRRGGVGGEDSTNILPAWHGKRMPGRPMFFNDHKEEKDHAACAFRWDDPAIDGTTFPGMWKVIFDASLLRRGIAQPLQLFDLSEDPDEDDDRLEEMDEKLQPLLKFMTEQALLHRTAGSHHLAQLGGEHRAALQFSNSATQIPGHPKEGKTSLADEHQGGAGHGFHAKVFDLTARLNKGLHARIESTIEVNGRETNVTLRSVNATGATGGGFNLNPRGLGISGGRFNQVDAGEAIAIRFDHDVLIEGVAVIAGNGVCGGYCQVGDRAPLAIYCVDADNDAQDQSGIMSDLGVLKRGQSLLLSSSPHWNAETPGRWRLEGLMFRLLE